MFQPKRKQSLTISIHAAREGGDDFSLFVIVAVTRFQSTPPVKAATVGLDGLASAPTISIHAAREGGDYSGIPQQHGFPHFNPRRP